MRDHNDPILLGRIGQVSHRVKAVCQRLAVGPCVLGGKTYYDLAAGLAHITNRWYT